jgi:predicted CXXCH cytochrome family protein
MPEFKIETVVCPRCHKPRERQVRVLTAKRRGKLCQGCASSMAGLKRMRPILRALDNDDPDVGVT